MDAFVVSFFFFLNKSNGLGGGGGPAGCVGFTFPVSFLSTVSLFFLCFLKGFILLNTSTGDGGGEGGCGGGVCEKAFPPNAIRKKLNKTIKQYFLLMAGFSWFSDIINRFF